MKAIIEAKKYRDTDSSYIVVEIRFLCVPMFYYKKAMGLLVDFYESIYISCYCKICSLGMTPVHCG